MTDDVDALEKTGPTGLWMSTTPGKDQGKIPRSRIAMACVNTDETSYDHLAMSNKHGMKKKKKPVNRFGQSNLGPLSFLS